MRQAGRVLPEYRALKERHTFLELVRTPDLAAEVTLQPILRFGFDAAIVFSDILVIPEAMGQGYSFADSGGIRMDFAIRTAADIDRLDATQVASRLDYVARTLRIVRRELAGRSALIGFSGSPWTLANFMLEGGSSPEFKKARAFFEANRIAYEALAEKLTAAIVEYLKLQCQAGAEALQIFDTLAHLLPDSDFAPASVRWIREIINRLGNAIPVIVFSKGAAHHWRELVEAGATVIGLDGSADLKRLRKEIPADTAIQGNLEPEVLTTNPAVVRRETRAILEVMRGRPGHIFNLGHGVPPTAALENVETLITTIREFS